MSKYKLTHYLTNTAS